jgi:hypothetical protein
LLQDHQTEFGRQHGPAEAFGSGRDAEGHPVTAAEAFSARQSERRHK